jgi:putative ABC transport system ATP-binding protein
MLRMEKVRKVFQTSDVETLALDNVSFSIDSGEFVAVMGRSGCGNSTLLNILGLLDTPTEGPYAFFGEELARAPESLLTQRRRERIGFVFQSFHLIDDLSVAENVDVGLLYRGVPASERCRRVGEALERVGLGHRAKPPRQLSGGQQQRVAVARGFVSQPSLVLADEPTGNLDSANGEAVMGLLTAAARSGVPW